MTYVFFDFAKLHQQLNQRDFTYLNELLEQCSPSSINDSILCIIQQIDQEKKRRVIRYIVYNKPLEWFMNYTLNRRMSSDLFECWSLLYLYLFQKKGHHKEKLLREVAETLEFGNEGVWMGEFDSLDEEERPQIFFELIICSRDESLIIQSIDYLSTYEKEEPEWYEYILAKFLDFSTGQYIPVFKRLSESPSFRMWFANLEQSFRGCSIQTLKQMCDLQTLHQQSTRCISSLILQSKLPADVIQYELLSYI